MAIQDDTLLSLLLAYSGQGLARLTILTTTDTLTSLSSSEDPAAW